MTKFDKVTAKMSTLEYVACWVGWIAACGLLGCTIGLSYQHDIIGSIIGLVFAWISPFIATCVLSTVSLWKARRT